MFDTNFVRCFKHRGRALNFFLFCNKFMYYNINKVRHRRYFIFFFRPAHLLISVYLCIIYIIDIIRVNLIRNMIFQKSWITELLIKKDDTQVYTKKKEISDEPTKSQPSPPNYLLLIFLYSLIKLTRVC